MKPFIASENLLGYRIWLEMLGYIKKDLPDGGATFKNKKMKPNYLLVSSTGTGCGACRKLYKEYVDHINS